MQQFVSEDTQYCFWFKDDSVTEENRKALSQQDNRDGVMAFLTDGLEEEWLDYEHVFSLDAELVYGIGFPLGVTRKVGSYNIHLPYADAGLHEFLCRILKEFDGCWVVSAGQAVKVMEHNGDQEEAAAFLYAYIIRYHMEHLRRIGRLNTVFQDVCALLQRKKCFGLFQKYMNQFLDNQGEFERLAGYTAPFVVLRGDDTCGGVLQQFSDDLTDALAANEQAVIEVGGDDKNYDRLQGMLCKGIIGFQSRALEIDFFRKLHGPKFQFWFDYPLHFAGVLRNLSDDEYVLCQDANYAELIRRFYHTPQAVQFPPGGKEVPYKEGERPYDIVFMGSWFADESDRLPELQKLFYGYMLEHPGLTFEQGFERMAVQPETRRQLIDDGFLAETESEESFIQHLMELKPACRSVIGYFRNKVIETILEMGIDLHVYGESWQSSPFKEYDNLFIHPQASPSDSIKELQKAKIGLNIMSWHKAGMTERIANIMLAGAVCLSDETAYLKEHLEAGKEIQLYRLETLEKLPVLIQEILDDPHGREQIAQRAYQKAVQEFSWNARAKQLIALAESRLFYC